MRGKLFCLHCRMSAKALPSSEVTPKLHNIDLEKLTLRPDINSKHRNILLIVHTSATVASQNNVSSAYWRCVTVSPPSPSCSPLIRC
ncbi:hypothetical protein Dimus_038205 [Dionaea muscipula]